MDGLIESRSRCVGDPVNGNGAAVFVHLIAFSFTSLLVFALVGSREAIPSNLWDSPVTQCQITPENYHFNLYPLSENVMYQDRSTSSQLVYETPLTITTIVYNRSLKGSLHDSLPKVGGNSQSRVGQYNLLQTRILHLLRFHHLVVSGGIWACTTNKLPTLILRPH